MNKIFMTVILSVMAFAARGERSDTVSPGIRWHLGMEATASGVPSTNRFLRGDNPSRKTVDASLESDFKAGFSFSPQSREGFLYPGLYQGVGLGLNTFFNSRALGTPGTAFAYQGAPIVHFRDKIWLGYEWQFGVAFGWRPDTEQKANNQAPVGTRVTALMGLGLRLNYDLDSRVRLFAGASARHYSNGNTAWPNKGINTIGATLGVEYMLTSPKEDRCPCPDADALKSETDKHRWEWDVMAYGAWRKRALVLKQDPLVVPGKFGIAGIRFEAMRSLCRYVAVGPAIEGQWDEGADLKRHWISGSNGENVKFTRPSFGKQLSLGASAHAELTMPIFTIDAGVGYDFLKPKGDGRFYQSLTLKTYIMRNIYLNVGYRLGRFRDPQNLMLGVGVRLK